MKTEYSARWKHTVFVFIVITLVLVSGLSSIATSYGSEGTKSLIPSPVNYLGMSTGRSGSVDDLGIHSFSAFSVTISPLVPGAPNLEESPLPLEKAFLVANVKHQKHGNHYRQGNDDDPQQEVIRKGCYLQVSRNSTPSY